MHCPSCGSERIKKKGQRGNRQRYKCNACGHYWTEGEKNILGEIASRYSPKELESLARGNGLGQVRERPVVNFEGEEVAIGFFTDSHIGEESFDDSLWYSFIEECAREKVNMILCAGDIHEGMSNRPEQIYHLKDFGYSAQMDHAEKLFRATSIPIKAIDGNHDRWGIKSGGIFAVRDLANRMPGHFEFLGSDCGDVEINGTIWRLHHGEDGSAYALSYRVQKIVESFTGGDKPNVLLTGHDHKAGYFFERNVHCILGGALSYQSAWMRSTRKACHTGFHILRARIRDGQIIRMSPTFYPFYS